MLAYSIEAITGFYRDELIMLSLRDDVRTLTAERTLWFRVLKSITEDQCST